jgi:ankyrin repeat protein
VSKNFLDLVKRGDTQEIAAWVEEEPQIAESRDPQGVSALLWAIYSGQTLVRDFLRSGLEPDLPEAAALGDTARLATLLGPDPAPMRERANSRSADGWPLLHLAAAFADAATVRLLLQAGADPGQVAQTPMRNQALHAVLALSRNPEIIGLLIEHGADVNAVQTAGYRPLHQAAIAGNADVVRMLLAAGADPQARCDRGKTAADYATERGHIEVAALLQ